jgi:hypothetical protein
MVWSRKLPVSVAWRQLMTIGLALLVASACAQGKTVKSTQPYNSLPSASATEDGAIFTFAGDAGRVAPNNATTITKTCDGGYTDSGQCICLRIAMLGRLPTYGAVPGKDDTAALQAWLNLKSTATVDTYTKKVELTTNFFAKYDLLILQALEEREGGPTWPLTSNEIANFESWVKKGGGVISLTGYGNQASEINPTNQLFSFTGLSYNPDDVITTPNSCSYCVGSSVTIKGWNTKHPISENIKAVGAFHGRSINVPVNGEVVISEGEKVLGATVQVEAGRVFIFADEWVTYTSQWTGEGVSTDCSLNQYNPCYGISADTLYQVPQFWYNAILWTSGRDCFKIDEPTIIY